jgi:hypothetical protein
MHGRHNWKELQMSCIFLDHAFSMRADLTLANITTEYYRDYAGGNKIKNTFVPLYRLVEIDCAKKN